MFQRVTFAGHAGAVHAPARPNGVTVVLCQPVGRDARCAYRALVHLADRLAGAGVTVLRYDHMGCGDSLPLDPDADQWAAWRAGVREAADFARARLGATRLVLAGLRLGATLAAVEAAAVAADGLVLLAPAESGRTWLREQQFAAGLLRGGSETRAPGAALELDGLSLSPATIDAVRQVDLRRMSPFPGPTFLAGPDFEGYEALFEEAHSSAAPQALFDEVVAWAGNLAPGRAAPVRLPPTTGLVTADWSEHPVTFGEGLQGVLCLPAHGQARRGVIIGNTGGDPRAGIGGFAAQACRTLAAQGVAALRFDFAGLGESHGPADGAPSHVYEVDRRADFAAAADVLQAEGCDEILLAGVCSGAHHALHAALDSERYAGVLAINVARLIWRRGDTLRLGAAAPPPRRLGRRDLLRPELWRKLLRGEANPWAIAKTQLDALWRACGPRDREVRALHAKLARFSARGGRAYMLIGRHDPAHRELEGCFGLDGRRIGALPGVTLRLLADLDHGLFFSPSRAKALAALLEFAAERPQPIIRAAPVAGVWQTMGLAEAA